MPPPSGWQLLDTLSYVGRNIDVKSMKAVTSDIVWILTKSNDVFVLKNGRLIPAPGLKVTSLSASKYGVWALDVNGHVHNRAGITENRPQGSSWSFTNLNGDGNFKEITNGPHGVLLGLSHKILFFCETMNPFFPCY